MKPGRKNLVSRFSAQQLDFTMTVHNTQEKKNAATNFVSTFSVAKKAHPHRVVCDHC